MPIILRGLGTVAAFNVATIRSQVEGYLDSVDFVEGQTVKQGDVLARVDPRIYQARLDEAKGKLEADQAQSMNVQTNLGRSEPLLKQGFATDLQVTGQKAKVSELQSIIDSDRAAVSYAQAELDFATVRAPFAGVTGIRLIDIGTWFRCSSSCSTGTPDDVDLAADDRFAPIRVFPSTEFRQSQYGIPYLRKCSHPVRNSVPQAQYDIPYPFLYLGSIPSAAWPYACAPPALPPP